MRHRSALEREEECGEQTQKLPEPSQQEGEVVSGGGQNGIDGIPLFASEIIPVHSVFALEVSNDGFDRRSSSHLALDGGRDAALLATGEDPQLVTFGSIMAAVSSIGQNAGELVANHLFHIRNDGRERVAVVRIAGQRCRVQGELPAL